MKQSINICYLVNKVTNTSIPGKLFGEYENVNIFVTDSFSDLLRNYKKFSIINTHHTRTALLVSFLFLLNLATKHKIFVHTVHRDLTKLSFFKKQIYKFFILNLRNNIICNSQNTGRSVQSLTKRPITVIYNGIDGQLFYPSKNKVKANGELVVTTVSRLIRSKRIDVLIKAVSKLNKLGYKIHLNILGSGPELSSLKALTNSLFLKNIEFFGEVPHDKVPDNLRLSDIYVTCSETEGFGNSTIEAYFCGLQIIATDIDVHKEIGGGEFMYFKRNSIDSL